MENIENIFNINDISGQCGDAIEHAHQFLPYVHKKLGFNKPVNVNFVSDPENAKNPLGKTGYYDPNKMEITIFVDKRHVKDILRSLSHELVHHAQNCRGEFDQGIETGAGYAQKNPHMRKMEAEAYLLGNGFLFRDWEDQLKEKKQMSNINEAKLRKYVNSLVKTMLKEGGRVAQRPAQDKRGLEEGVVDGTPCKPGEEPPIKGKGYTCVKNHHGDYVWGRPSEMKRHAGTKKEGLEEDKSKKCTDNSDCKDDEYCEDGECKKVIGCAHPGHHGKDCPDLKEGNEGPFGILEADMSDQACKEHADCPDGFDCVDGECKENVGVTNENWFKGNKNELLFETLIKKWTK